MEGVNQEPSSEVDSLFFFFFWPLVVEGKIKFCLDHLVLFNHHYVLVFPLALAFALLLYQVERGSLV